MTTCLCLLFSVYTLHTNLSSKSSSRRIFNTFIVDIKSKHEYNDELTLITMSVCFGKVYRYTEKKKII